MTTKLTVYVLINAVVVLVGVVLIFAGYRKDSATGGPLAATGASMVASGVVAVFYLAYRKIELREFRSTDLYHKHGLEGIYLVRDLTERYSELIRTVDRTGVDVLGFGLQHFLEDHGTDVAEKARAGIPVRLLVMDPDWPGALLQEQAEQQQAGAFATHVARVTSFVAQQRIPELHARKYRALPGTMVFRIGATMFVGPYFHRRLSRQTVTLEITRSGALFERYQQHFDSLWEDGHEL